MVSLEIFESLLRIASISHLSPHGGQSDGNAGLYFRHTVQRHEIPLHTSCVLFAEHSFDFELKFREACNGGNLFYV